MPSSTSMPSSSSVPSSTTMPSSSSMPSSTTLPSKNASPAKLFRKFAWNPEPRLDYVIRDLPLPQTSPIRQMSASSSMGRIDILPPELLLMVLNLLDFQALSRLSRVSHRAKTTVEGLAAYRELFEHAPDVLVALGKTRLLRYHSAALLRQTLRESRCVSCFDFGAYLNLPTCERVCLECLRRNYASRVVPVNTARECFHLTNKHLKKIPILYSIPGEYGVQDGFQFRRRVLRMVSAKQAKQLAIEVHGSAENVANLLPTTQTQDMPFEKFNTFQWLRETPLEPPGYDLSRDAERFFDRDLNGGMASIRMPCLSGTIADRGWVCKGCYCLDELHSQGLIPAAVSEDIAPDRFMLSRRLRAMKFRLHSREGFLEHIRTCYGANRILAGWKEPTRRMW